MNHLCIKKPAIVLVLLCIVAGASAQEIDEPIISPRFDYAPASMKGGVFIAYASGAVEGSYYYMLPTNAYVSSSPTTALPNGECRYLDLVTQQEKRIGEQVVGYRGDNTFAFLQSTNPKFTRFRTVSPCFDGSLGEESEQQHRTFAYGAGSTVVSAVKGKVYLTVNRTRYRNRPDSTLLHELFSNGAEWLSGDFDQIFIGARQTLSTALNTPTSSSGICRGEPNSLTSGRCNSAFTWKTTPLVKITDNLIDPADGKAKTFSALPPLLAELNTATDSLPIFSGISARGAVLFGFMEFGHICMSWVAGQPRPVCTQPGFPSRLAAVYLTDTSTTERPSSARLHFKQGSSWIAMNNDGTFPSVPDDFASTLGVYSLSDIKYDPIKSTWKVWTEEIISTTSTTPGCEDSTLDQGSRLAVVNLANYAKTVLWPSRNGYGRVSPLAHYVFSPACNCLREFIFYSSSDYACYNLSTTSRGHEVLVRRHLDGAPNQ